MSITDLCAMQSESTFESVSSFADRISEDIETLDKLSMQKDFEGPYRYAAEIFQRQLQRIPIVFSLVESNTICRVRRNDHTLERALFNLESEISYNPNPEEAGRFNCKHTPMFYGSIRDEFSEQHFAVAAILETCKWLLHPSYTGKQETFTFGRWDVQTPFRLIDLRFNDNHLLHNPNAKSHIDVFFAEVAAKFESRYSDEIIQFWKFMSNLSCRKCEDTKGAYAVLNAFFSVVQQVEYDKQGDTATPIANGIMYPSSMTEAAGLNIVLTPESVGEYIKLTKAGMCRIVRFSDKPKDYHIGPCSDAANVIEGRFIFKSVY